MNDTETLKEIASLFFGEERTELTRKELIIANKLVVAGFLAINIGVDPPMYERRKNERLPS